MRWKFMIQWIVVGLLGVLLIGCTTPMINPTTIGAYAGEGWVVAQPAAQAKPTEGPKTETTPTHSCPDPEKIPLIPLPGGGPTENGLVVSVPPQEPGCATIFNSDSSPCSPNATPACTGPAGAYCSRIVATAGSSGFSCASSGFFSGFWFSVVGGNSCSFITDGNPQPPNAVSDLAWAGGPNSIVGFSPAGSGCMMTPSDFITVTPGAVENTSRTITCPGGTYSVTFTTLGDPFFPVTGSFSISAASN